MELEIKILDGCLYGKDGYFKAFIVTYYLKETESLAIINALDSLSGWGKTKIEAIEDLKKNFNVLKSFIMEAEV